MATTDAPIRPQLPSNNSHPESRPRYRWRTALRGYLPERLAIRIPKGVHDCGAHEWYEDEPGTWRCYHCRVGITHQVPWDDREYEARLLEADAMRIRAGLPVQEHFPSADIATIGYYTAAEVARLAGVTPRRIGQWTRHAIILPSVSRRPNIYSYADAGEAVLAHYLIDNGFEPRDVRGIVHKLRDEFGPWPLAIAPLRYEGKLALIQRSDGLYDFVRPSEQKVIRGTLLDLRDIRDALNHGGWVAYGRPREYVEVDPDRHSGEPVVRGRRIATSRVAALAALPGGREELKDAFGLTDAEIDDAVGYEHDLEALAARVWRNSQSPVVTGDSGGGVLARYPWFWTVLPHRRAALAWGLRCACYGGQRCMVWGDSFLAWTTRSGSSRQPSALVSCWEQ